MPLLPAAPGLYPTAVARLLRGLALAGQARAGDGDERGELLSELDEVTRLAGRPRRGRAGELPAPAAAGRGRAGLGGRRLPRRRARLRRRAPRGRRPPAALAPGPDHRTRGPLLPRPRPRPRRLRAARPGPPGVRRLGRDARRSTSSTGPTRPASPPPTRPSASTSPPTIARGRAAVTTGTIDLLGILSASQALSSRDQHRPAARPRGRGARRDDRRHRRAPAAVERRPRTTGCCPHPAGGATPVSGTGHEHAAAAVGAALRPAHPRTAGRGRRHPRRPLRPRPVLRRPRPLLAAGRAHPQPRQPAGGAAAGEPAASAARSPPTGSTPSRSSPASSPSPSTTPSSTPSSPPRGRGSSPPPTRPAAASSATCTTAPSSDWSPSPCACARPRRRCRPASTS